MADESATENAPAIESPLTDTRIWAIVEVFGKQSYGGVIRQVEMLGASFLEVTVMESFRNREFSVKLAAGSIFRMRETTEAAARANYSSVPDEHRIEVAYGGRIGHSSPPMPDEVDDVEIFCSICTCEITSASASLHGGLCADCHAESGGFVP